MARGSSTGSVDGTRREQPVDLVPRCVSVLVAGATYGIVIQEVREIVEPRPLTRIFRAPTAVAGVTSLRGEILPVLDLGVLLGVASARPSATGESSEARIVVVHEPAGARRRAGLRVDALGPVREMPGGITALEPVPPTVGPKARAMLRGVLDDAPLCALIDLRALLDAPELAALAGVGG